MKIFNARLRVLLGAALVIGGSHPAFAEVGEVTIARQYGVSYLPLMVMEQNKLLEKQAKAAGLGDIKVNWRTFAGGAAMNDALLSGNLQFASAGVPPFLILWAKTKGNLDVKGVCAMTTMPSYLITRNPDIKSLKDFGEGDKIALPAVKVSNQAVYLQMAAAQAFGIDHYNKLDKLTVTMSFADSTVAMLSGSGEINSNFVSPPYSQQQLAKPGLRSILNSYDVMGGPSTLIVMYATSRFRDTNPKTYAAFLSAFAQATAIVNQDKKAAAAFYLRAAKGTDTLEMIEKIISDPQVEYTMTPKGILKYADFMHKVGTLNAAPASWKDVFFPDVQALPGS